MIFFFCFPGLHAGAISWYSLFADAKSSAGICSPCNSMATPDAPCVFFYVVAPASLFFGQWFLYLCLYQIMVARAGQPLGWPVSIEAGTANPVRATTHEICSSGGGINRYSMETAIMATVTHSPHIQFVFVFAALRRCERHSRIQMLRTVAASERAARLPPARDYILSLAARLPVMEVRA
ncbi:host cell division inhibitor Icd-like protein [Erwinia billingiae]|uniref:host cell division inhibitor Icd-like protein n=1 Tax=Erwinia billingiae TaxID=182337 RepID=UPI00092D53D8|nr:host cell division inhibitor Icd-like protein [Erwinia billingiae]